jgi:putative ABC transport system substrate-binding protein
MRRREFITLVGGGAATWPLAASAQQQAMPVIGFLSSASAGPFAHLLAAFLQGLREVGYVEGYNVAIEYRWAENQPDRLPSLATDLVRRQVAVIVASGANLPVAVAKAATATIPIVFTGADDPVKNGLVSSLSRPGGNVTGMALFTAELVAKQLDLLRELAPNAPSLAVLLNPNNPNVENQLQELRQAPTRTGQQLFFLKATNAYDIDAAFSTMTSQRVGAILVCPDPFFNTAREQISALAFHHRIPTINAFRDFTAAGGLVSYGNSLSESYRQTAIYVGRILKGEKPVDLPVLQPTKFELVINLKTAKALGLAIPDKLLALADEVIE